MMGGSPRAVRKIVATWLALLEDRYDRRATIVTSQLPGEHWHEALGDPPLPTPSSLVWCTTPIRGT
jgi:hypothetical protein